MSLVEYLQIEVPCTKNLIDLILATNVCHGSEMKNAMWRRKDTICWNLRFRTSGEVVVKDIRSYLARDST
jgi:hypothetical protein